MSQYNRKHGATSGRKRTKEYRAWKSIKDRCYLKTSKSYPRYGGRGISMCKEWRTSFLEFLNHIGLSPSPKLQVERKNNSGNYEPGNVVWATVRQQSRNRRTNVFSEFMGRTQCAKDWAHEIGVPYYTVIRKINAGWSVGRIIAKYKEP